MKRSDAARTADDDSLQRAADAWALRGGRSGVPARPEPPSAHRHTIVLIEDDDDTRAAFAEALRRLHGCAVVAASTPADALSAHYAGTTPCCMILLDDSKGTGAASSMTFAVAKRSVHALADAPILVVSGDMYIGERAAAIGAAAYMLKPVDLEALLQLIDKYCKG